MPLYVAYSPTLAARASVQSGQGVPLKFGHTLPRYATAEALAKRFNKGLFSLEAGRRTLPLARCEDWRALGVFDGAEEDESVVFGVLGRHLFPFLLRPKIQAEIKAADPASLEAGLNGLGEIRCVAPDQVALAWERTQELCGAGTPARVVLGFACLWLLRRRPSRADLTLRLRQSAGRSDGPRLIAG